MCRSGTAVSNALSLAATVKCGLNKLKDHKLKTNRKYIILFLFIAFGLSYPVQKGYLIELFNSFAKDTFLSESSYLLAGFSTLIAAIVALVFHKKLSNRIAILGDDKVKNLLILCLPVVSFAIIGLDNSFEMNKYLYGFSFALTNTVYAFTEEVGWRKYLQNALEGLNKNLKYLLIGIIWWVWHFRFDSPFDLFIFPLICIGGGVSFRKTG